MATLASEEAKPKPLDRWLELGGVAVSVIFFLIPPKAPLTIVGCLLLIAALLFHPLWNFYWVDKRLVRRICALMVLALMLTGFGYYIWPKEIVIQPTSVNFDQTGELNSFSVRNISERPLYAVNIVLRAKPRSTALASLHLMIPPGSLRTLRQQSLDPDIVFADADGFGGNDASGNPIFMVRFDRLAPGESRQIDLTFGSSGTRIAGSLPSTLDLRGNANVNVRSSVMSYSFVETPIRNQNGRLSLPVRITEGGIALKEAITCFMRPFGPPCDVRLLGKPGSLKKGEYWIALTSWKGGKSK